jgi:hypothetical protein
MDQTPVVRPSIWRFSLRELFLLTLAAGALLGWGTVLFPHYFWRFQPTTFFMNDEGLPKYAAGWETDIKRICAELGEPVPERVVRTITNNDGSTAARRTMYFRFSLPTSKRKAFTDAFEARARERLKAAGCTPGGAAYGFRINETRTLTYQRGPLGGACDICVTEGPEGETCLIVNMCEMKGHFFSAGVSVPQTAD